jgi:ClpP class serine protease
MVDRVYGRFTDAVAKYRGMSPAAVRATEAAVYLGRDAIDARLADEVGGVDQAVAAMARHLKATRSAPPVRAGPGPGRPARGVLARTSSRSPR